AAPTLPGASPTPAPAAGPAQPPPVPEDTEIILPGQTVEPVQEGVPATLPRELQKNAPNAQVADKKGALTIEEIVNAPIVSASRRKEGALSAPAFVIVLTAK